MLTGEGKWNREPVGPGVHEAHVNKLRQMASSEREWAHEAVEPGASLLYVATGGFADGFREVAEADGHSVTCWSLEDVYADDAG